MNAVHADAECRLKPLDCEVLEFEPSDEEIDGYGELSPTPAAIVAADLDFEGLTPGVEVRFLHMPVDSDGPTEVGVL